jgi:chaperonin cofactor prefoldin
MNGTGGGNTLTEDKDILDEINRLREDVRQLREVVNILVNVVMEDDLDEDEDEFSTFAQRDGRFNLYN